MSVVQPQQAGGLAAAGAAGPGGGPIAASAQQQQQLQPRFEDLTIDDDLPLLPRMQRYVQSSIALQRLVHVRMLGEVALEVGQKLTATELVPLFTPLVKDSESIIRQRVCVELKVICLVLMGMTGSSGGGGADDYDTTAKIITSLPQIPKPDQSSKYYKVMVQHLFPHLFTLISDPDNEVRRAASETIVKLALRVAVEDVVTLALSIPLRLVKEGQKRATSNNTAQSNNTNGVGNNNNNAAGNANNNNNTNAQTPAEDLLITASNLLADLSSFLPPTRLSPDTATRYFSPTILALADDPNFRVRRAAVQALPRMMGGATLDDVKRRLLPKFISLSGDEMYRVRKASGECLVDLSRALTMLPWRLHFVDVWVDYDDDDENNNGANSGNNKNNSSSTSSMFYKPRTNKQINDLHSTIRECHEVRRQALCSIAKKLLEDNNKFVRYGMMQFLGPLIASFYPLDRGSMVGGMGGLLFQSREGSSSNMGTLSVGVESLGIAKSFTGLERVGINRGIRMERFDCVEDVLSYNHSLRGLELILHGESSISQNVLAYGGSNANNAPFGTIGPQFFPHANGMVGRSSALDDDDTDSILLKANLKKYNRTSQSGGGSPSNNALSSSSPRALFPKFILESRSDALALSRICSHRNGRVPTNTNSSAALPYPPLMMGRPDPEDLKSIRSTLLQPFSAMASCQTGEETTDAEMRVYCAYSLPAVILLFGGSNWERDGLKKCFLDLIRKVGNGNEGDGGDSNSPPPLPVKRCLASSVHAVAHMLGPEIVSRDKEFLASFEVSFLSDSDEAIRLNMLKNLASFIGSIPPGDGVGHRNYYLPIIHSTIMGEDVLGAAKIRSASNPGVLNWRQRDAVARVIPDLIVLYDAALVREYLWPILKTLLSDSVSIVREDAGWSIPVILRKYAKATKENDANLYIKEVIEWLKETHLDDVNDNPLARKSTRHRKKQMVASEGAFSKRQGYCRILAAVSLVMRMDEKSNDVSFTNESRMKDEPYPPIDPFGPLSPSERDRFRSIVVNNLLPPALEMTVDCVANVRLTLTKCLKMLPADIRQESHVEEVLNTLEEELMTWDVPDTLPLCDAASAVGAASGGVSSSDPPSTQRMVDGVMMTSTMSAC
ncbi:hypothetical protein ACHAXM_005679 [Skeletonema potamos]|jgi:serine/threonine-protein phosphatase 4 regulatory subunit 1